MAKDVLPSTRRRASLTDETGLSRRGLIAAGGLGLVGATIAAPAAAYTPPSPVDTGAVKGGKVEFPNWRGDADKPSAPPPAPEAPAKRVGLAIVGLGRLALEEILPAFGEAKKARPIALVSGSPDKARIVAEQYGIKPEAIYDYASFDRIADIPRSRRSTSCSPTLCTASSWSAPRRPASMCSARSRWRPTRRTRAR
jgi:hypothetical protein